MPKTKKVKLGPARFTDETPQKGLWVTFNPQTPCKILSLLVVEEHAGHFTPDVLCRLHIGTDVVCSKIPANKKANIKNRTADPGVVVSVWVAHTNKLQTGQALTVTPVLEVEEVK